MRCTPLPALLLLAAAVSPLPAQSLRGRITTPAGEAVAAALLTLQDEAGSARRLGTSDGSGAFALETGDTGRFVLRVERPGQRPYTSDAFRLTRTDTVRLALTVPAEPVALGALKAGSMPCVAGAVTGAAAGLWDAARISFSVMALGEEAGRLGVRGVRYLRLLDLGSVQRAVLDQEPFAGSSVPYPAARAFELPPGGFAVPGAEGVVEYHVPSPAVLLSPAFLRTHCIDRVVLARNRRDQVGLGFRPAGRTGVGIEGVLWLDRTSAEPRVVEYQYRDPERKLPRGARGGVGFARGEDGMPQVSRWWVRVPRELQTTFREGGSELTTSIVESGVFVLGASERPLDDPEGVFALLNTMFVLDAIRVEAVRAQREMVEGAVARIRLDQIPGAPQTDALDVVRSYRPSWLARAHAWSLEGGAGGDCVVYLDRMRWSGDRYDCRAALAQIPTSWIASIEYVPPIEAAAIYGQGHGYGVIVIRSRRQ